MDNSTIKQEMMNLFQSMRSSITGLVDDLDSEQKNFRGSIQKWGVKDMLVHLAFWGGHLTRELEAEREGRHAPEAGDYYELINDGVLLHNLDKPFEEAREEEQAVFDKLIALIKTESPDDLVDKKKYAFADGRSLLDCMLSTECWHVLDHLSSYYLKESRYDKAEKLQEEYTAKLMSFPTWKANAFYNLACFYSLNGKKEKALNNLELAFKERPDLKEWSKKDSDIDPIRSEAVYKALVN
jgi:tetratricopeptide (TPR) repeat protein